MWKYLIETKRAGLEEKNQYIFKHYKFFPVNQLMMNLITRKFLLHNYTTAKQINKK